MKLTAIFLLIACLQVSAKGYSQTVTLSIKNASLKEVFTQINKQTGFSFVWEAKVLKKTKPVSLNLKDASIEETLDACLKDQLLSYIINQNLVFIKPALITQKQPVAKPERKPEPPPVRIRGTVLSNENMPLSGASVSLKKTNIGTITDEQGNFSLEIPDAGGALIISYVGYQTTEIPISKSSDQLRIVLKLVESKIDEVVVIGYGSQQKKNVSGAIVSVKGKNLDVSTATNFAQTLQGKASGVQVIQLTGQPGASVSVQIRSNPSNANAGVLYVVDGVPINGGAGIPGGVGANLGGTDQSGLNFINPGDIESIEFLKDASSAAIYGARAGAGVVLITTKRGKSGKPSLQYSGSYGFQQVGKMYEVLDTKTYMKQVNMIGLENWMQSNKVAPYYGNVDGSTLTPYTPVFAQQQIDTTQAFPSAMKAITRNGYTQQHNISITGGNDKTHYFISGNYLDQKGVLLATDFKRYNSRINIDQAISDKIKVGVNFLTSNTVSHTTGTAGRYETGGIVSAALYYPANMPLQNPDGSYPLNPRYTPIPNPLSYATVENPVYTSRLLTNAYAEWEIIKGLTAKGNFSYDQSTARRNTYLPTSFSPGAAVSGQASKGENNANISLTEYTLNYNKRIGERQTINALLGYSYNVSSGDGTYAQNQSFVSDVFSYYNLGAGQNVSPGVGSSQYKTVWASYVGRVIYTLDGKYTLQASLRRDGSDQFATSKKWGYFPAVSASWLLSEEKFLQSSNIISLLKLRAAYGELGNSNFGTNAFAAYGIGGSPLFGTNSPSTGIFLAQAANPNLSWETAADVNIGVDFGVLKNRISGSFDYFRKTIRNLLSYVPFPADFTVGGVWSNAGTTRSVGYDIGLQTKNIVSSSNKGFNWSTSITFSHYLNYWVNRSPGALATLPKYVAPSGKDALFNGIYGYVSEGLYKGGQSKPSTMTDMIPGNIIIKDIHGYDATGNLTGPDGAITEADKTLLANGDPKFSFGIGNTFTYKSFDLNIFFSGVSRKLVSPYAPSQQYRIASLNANMGSFGWNTMPVSLTRWSFQNTNSDFPTGLSDPKYASYQNASSYWLVDGSFLRCRNITLGYSVPASLLKDQKVFSGLRISFDVQNPFTITKYPGLDPELSVGNYYPLTKSYVIGINANF